MHAKHQIYPLQVHVHKLDWRHKVQETKHMFTTHPHIIIPFQSKKDFYIGIGISTHIVMWPIVVFSLLIWIVWAWNIQPITSHD
jgi:hypothetical protein